MDREKIPLSQDREVRWALFQAFDRKAIIDSIFLGYSAVAVRTLSIPSTVHSTDCVETPYPFDLHRARPLLLYQAGWTDSPGVVVEKYGTQLQFELTYAEDLSTFEPLVPYMQQQWQVIGAEMRMSPLLFPELLDTIHDNDDYDLALLVLSWLADRDRKVMLAWNKYDGGLNSTRSGNRC